jgi:hypothetical protein
MPVEVFGRVMLNELCVDIAYVSGVHRVKGIEFMSSKLEPAGSGPGSGTRQVRTWRAHVTQSRLRVSR